MLIDYIHPELSTSAHNEQGYKDLIQSEVNVFSKYCFCNCMFCRCN